MSNQNVELVRSSYAAFGRGDIDGVLATLDTDIEWTTPGPEGLLSAGTRRGHDAVREFFKTIDQLYEFQRFEPTRFVADGDQVIVLGEDTVKVKATGKVIKEHWAHAMTVKTGKVVAFREYMDTSSVVAELRPTEAGA